MLPVNQPLGIDQCNRFALRKASRQIWREAQRQFEQLNGANNVTALRQGLRGMIAGDVAMRSSEN